MSLVGYVALHFAAAQLGELLRRPRTTFKGNQHLPSFAEQLPSFAHEWCCTRRFIRSGAVTQEREAWPPVIPSFAN